jgi:hypothetical protein
VASGVIKKMKMKEYKTQCWEEYEENNWSQDRKRKKNIKKVFGMKKKRELEGYKI